MNKEHVSFSEIKQYSDCGFRHHLTYLENNREPDTIHLVFGNAVHDSIDSFKKGNKNSWITMCKTIIKWIKENPTHRYKNKKGQWIEEVLDPEKWTKQALGIYSEIFDWLDKKFPGYELIGSEIFLYEPIENVEDLKFKGYIDFLIKFDGKYHLIDFKTCSWGWDRNKRSDTHKQYQLTLYKNFVCKKLEIDPKNMETHFVLLKRTPPKQESRVELITISSGAKKSENANAWMMKQVKLMKRGLKLKNRTGCKYCPFHHTKLCP